MEAADRKVLCRIPERFRFLTRIGDMRPASARNILCAIENWSELARHAHYRVLPLARLCRVSVGSLRGFIWRTWGKPPKQWLNDFRSRESEQRLKNGERPKDISNILGYRDQSHFDHHFHQDHGMSPRQWKERNDRFKAL